MLSRWVLKQYQKIYCLSRWFRIHFTVMGHLCLIIWLIAGVFGIDTSGSHTYQLFVFLSFIFLFALLGSSFNRFSGTVKRRLPRFVTAGESLSYSVEVTNTSHKNYTGLVYREQLTEVFPSVSELTKFYQREDKVWVKRWISFRLWRRYLILQRGGDVNEQRLPVLDRRSAASIKMKWTPLRRGKIYFSGAYLIKPDLLGLFRRLFFVPKTQSCLVLPKRYPVKSLCFTGSRQYQAGGVSLANSVGDSTEFMGLRDYRQGDPFMHIHWKSLARYNKLIVKEYQDEYFVRKALVLDTSAETLDHALFEASVSVAASLAISEQENEALLDLMFVGHETYRFTAGRGVDHMPKLQEVLATVKKSDHSSFERLQQAVMQHSQQCSRLYCILLHWDKARQTFIQNLAANNVPVAVFLIHDGTLKKEAIEQPPEHFYLLNIQSLAEDLAAL